MKKRPYNEGTAVSKRTRTIDLLGQRFSSLVVIKSADRMHGETAWECRCDCGEVVKAKTARLRSGETKRCKKCNAVYVGKLNTTHGASMNPSKLYITWLSMRWRCHNKNRKDYKHYGGRGITICEDWRSYQAFKDWSEENGYSEDLSIDRRDNNGNYTPDNCRWATPKQQANNKRTNRMLTLDGVSKTITQWGESTGLGSDAIGKRIDTMGWSVEKALTTPKRKMNMKRRPK